MPDAPLATPAFLEEGPSLLVGRDLETQPSCLLMPTRAPGRVALGCLPAPFGLPSASFATETSDGALRVLTLLVSRTALRGKRGSCLLF